MRPGGPGARRVRSGAALATAVAALLSGCSGTDRDKQSGPAGTTADPAVEITVFAAASLTDVFGEVVARFGEEHPEATVTLSFGASSDLATQIVEGAPADVFAAASTATMDAVTTAGLARGDPTVFATNSLEIAVPPDNPGRVESLADLADPELVLALCAPVVPCGAAAEHLLDLTGIAAEPDTLEEDVRATLTKVQLGEVDAALVYRTDVLAAGDTVRGITIPQASQVVNSYPVVALTDAAAPELAAAFVTFLGSAEVAEVLQDAGFGTPGP